MTSFSTIPTETNRPLHTPGDSEPFVHPGSVVRKIWGSADIILFIFAGAAAEFACNKAVDWLYFTGKLPADPLGRLFSTVGYARRIIFATTAQAHHAIDTIRHIHTGVEQQRGATIPDWAYRDVLFMLVHYSVAAYELFERRLTEAEKDEAYDVFLRVGQRMGISGLPPNYTAWLPVRTQHMADHLHHSQYTAHLYKQYRHHLGAVRYRILLEGQKLILPRVVRHHLRLGALSALVVVVPLYKLCKALRLDWLLKSLLLPPAYKDQVRALEMG